MHESGNNQQGFALIAVLMLVSLVAALLGAHYLLTRGDLSTTKSAMDRTRGFYAAEGGLNLRADQIRAEFEGFNRPTGSPPPDLPGQLPCTPGATGTGDFACRSYSFSDRDVRTYVTEDPANPVDPKQYKKDMKKKSKKVGQPDDPSAPMLQLPQPDQATALPAPASPQPVTSP